MIDSHSAKARDDDLVHVLGYMHFSSGRTDPKTLAAMNRLYGLALTSGSTTKRPLAGMPAWLTIQQWLQDRLTLLGESKPTFRENEQASEVLALVWMDLLPSYLDFHRDLLFHQEPEGLFNGFFLGRAIETILEQGGPWHQRDRIIPAAIDRLNSLVGYRPVAVLESGQLEPYDNEWVCPVPLYLAGVGVAEGPYQEIIQATMDILAKTDSRILRSAGLDLEMLNELAFDPRAYDFDHPLNKRVNYQFGTWDPNSADEEGYYRRFVIQQVTLDAVLARVDVEREMSAQEVNFEAAAVLAGTILMASGVTGWGPTAYDSNVTLTSLLTPIANFRDQFYVDVLARLEGNHAERLKEEASRRRQPFGGARQHLNGHMAKLRASQLEHVQLAKLFARMGSAESARMETDHVPVPSARMSCRIDCLLTTGRQLLREGQLEAAVKLPDDIVDILHRGIECGALVDPWNILGFAGNFPYFPSSDAACEDHRIRELNDLLERISAFFSRLWREASAANDQPTSERIRLRFLDLANWWHQYAAHELEDIAAINLLNSYQSAELVARALRLWYAGGASSGDVRFWAEHAELFDSPRAYALVIEALLERNDYVASMALLVHWLGEAKQTGLRSGETSFADLAQNWFYQLNKYTAKQVTTLTEVAVLPSEDLDDDEQITQKEADISKRDQNAPESSKSKSKSKSKRLAEKQSAKPTVESKSEMDPLAAHAEAIQKQLECWALTKRFFDFIEANAEDFWQPPKFNLKDSKVRHEEQDMNIEELETSFNPESEEGEDLFESAYEDFVYEDSTDDGFEGAIFEEESDSQDELISESRRLGEHLGFLVAIARMWKDTALQTCLDRRSLGEDKSQVDCRIDSLKQWCHQSGEHLRGSLTLIEQIRGYHVARGGADQDSMSRYDRKRVIKESLMERTIQAALEIADSRRMLFAAILAINPDRDDAVKSLSDDLSGNDWAVVEIFANLLAGNRGLVEEQYPSFLAALRREKLLYVPMARGGDPAEIFRVRLRRRSLSHLLTWLPRQGLFLAASQLIETARSMEHHNHVGPGAVTEFDDLFQIAFRSMARAVARNAYSFRPNNGALSDMELEHIVEHSIAEPAVPRLLGLIERLTEVLLHSWLSHSRTLRLSVLELIDTPNAWNELVDFIKTYGSGIFTQAFLKLGNVRAILHQGVETWLEQAREQNEDTPISPIVAAIDAGKLELADASKWLSIILESILDHYPEYRDYNSTTTQSDRGEMIYMLLDFLRLRVRYDRVSWNLKPVFLAHEVLVRNGCQQTAQQWRRALAERVGREANQYLNGLAKLQETYAMRMPSIADRLGERFLKPMNIGRMRALIRPAMKQLQRPGTRGVSAAFELLLQEAHLMMREPTGVGFETPEWLVALHEEVDQIVENRISRIKEVAFERAVPFIYLRATEIEGQFDAFAKQSRTRNLP